MDLNAYFARIGYTEGGSDSERLRRVHLGHITHIPFEDIDVFNGKILSLRPEDLERKLVTERRGGYCFEMNGLFCEAVRAMGIPIYGVLARVARGEGQFSAHSHRMNVAEADGVRYVCDVGFGGDCFTEPLRLEPGLEQDIRGVRYRIMPGEQVQYSVQILRDGGYADLLGFDDIPALPEDFEVSNFYTNCHPTSGFRGFLMLNRFTEDGRVSMFNLQLTVTKNGEVTRREVPFRELPAVLQEHFGLAAAPDHAPQPLKLG